MSSQHVWAITGASSGLGHAIAKLALERNDKVIAFARNASSLTPLTDAYPTLCAPVQLDLEAGDAIVQTTAREAVLSFGGGRVDYVVNSAGYSYAATVEEGGAQGIREQFKANVYGGISLTSALLPFMRDKRSGAIAFVGSRSAWRTNYIMHGPYSSSKVVIAAIADVLREELRPFDIRVLTVVPGGLRTGGFGYSHFHPGADLLTASSSSQTAEVPEYKQHRATFRAYANKVQGAQSGDVSKAAKVVFDVLVGEHEKGWTDTLYLGSDCVRDVRARIERELRTLDEWEDVARSVDFAPE